MSSVTLLPRRLAAAGVALAVSGAVLAGPTQAAETFSVTVSKTLDLVADGETVSVTLANLPQGKGVYVLQCAAPSVAGERPTLCNSATQKWVTTSLPVGTPGVVAPGAPVPLSVAAAFTYTNRATGQSSVVDCTTSQCGVFVRLDHFFTTDRSLDTFVPISFVGSTIVLPADVVNVSVKDAPVGTRAPLNLKYRTPVWLNVSAQSGQTPTITSLNGNCVVQGRKVTAVKGSGECAFQVTTPRTASTAAGSVLVPAYLAPAEQAIRKPVPTKARVGKSRTLASTEVTTTMKQKVTWMTRTPGCRLETVAGQVRLIASTQTTCEVTASAPAREGLWQALTTTYRVDVRR